MTCFFSQLMVSVHLQSFLSLSASLDASVMERIEDTLRNWVVNLPEELKVLVLKLEDDLMDANVERFKEAKQFRAFCHVKELPAIIAVHQGNVMIHEEGGNAVDKLRSRLEALQATWKNGIAAAGVSPTFLPQEESKMPREETESVPYEAESIESDTCNPSTGENIDLTASINANSSQSLRIKLVFPDGRKLVRMFDSQDHLSNVLEEVNSVYDENIYVLRIKENGKELKIAQKNSTLMELGVEDRSQLIIGPNKDGRQNDSGEWQQNALRQPADRNLSMHISDDDAKTTTNPNNSLIAAKAPENSSRGPSGICVLQLRLLDGTVLKASFDSGAKLEAIRLYIDTEINGIGAYDLVCPFPRRVYQDSDAQKTLEALGLVPRSTILVQPKSKSQSIDTTDASISSPSRYLGYIYLALKQAVLLILKIWKTIRAKTIVSGKRTHSFTALPKPPNLSERGTQSGLNAIRTLPNGSETGSKPTNTYWNGNSTVYDGDEGEK